MIVPIPLHITLGLCSRIIDQVYPPLVREEAVEAAKAKAKPTPSAACGGKAAVHELNGRELATWPKKDMCLFLPNSFKLLAEAASADTRDLQ
jgi:hypothetical protein